MDGWMDGEINGTTIVDGIKEKMVMLTFLIDSYNDGALDRFCVTDAASEGSLKWKGS